MDYDLAVIGAGWAGFNAVLKARESGLKTVLIEKEQLGGTCLNRGCIPTKTLIQSAKTYSLAKKSSVFGIEIKSASINFNEIQARKDKIISQLRQGMNFMLKGIDFINARAQLLGPDRLRAGSKELSAKAILVACGSKPAELEKLRFDHKKIISSDDILNLKELPRTILIIGAGVIGCEFAGLFSSLGVKVCLVEKMSQLLPGEDNEIARRLRAVFKKKGIEVNTDSDAADFNFDDYDLILLCIGRTPNLADCGLEEAGIKVEKGRVVTDEYLKTDTPGIYAAGDCTAKVMLAHFAAYQGRLAAGNIADPCGPEKADNVNIPSCIFTDPEIASVGLSEEKAKGRGIDIEISKFDFMGSGMARIMDEGEGFIKIISDKSTGRISGASVIGPRATELIATLTLALSARLTVSQVSKAVFAHPTISESIGEALR
ncbi:MAG: dihydrolipoyl dehydrogenase [Candidatus Omnitrophica bacterium]|nr:dihydrolipoyl dehydrogenase [Candidatus Omnitrophota bacterium]